MFQHASAKGKRAASMVGSGLNPTRKWNGFLLAGWGCGFVLRTDAQILGVGGVEGVVWFRATSTRGSW